MHMYVIKTEKHYIDFNSSLKQEQRTYHTLYTPQEVLCIWRGTVDRSNLPKTDLDHSCCCYPDDWYTNETLIKVITLSL